MAQRMAALAGTLWCAARGASPASSCTTWARRTCSPATRSISTCAHLSCPVVPLAHDACRGGSRPTNYFTDNSVVKSNYRCVVIHGTHETQVLRNVAFDITGSCYYIEDGVEQNNVHEISSAIVPITNAL